MPNDRDDLLRYQAEIERLLARMLPTASGQDQKEIAWELAKLLKARLLHVKEKVT